MKPLQTIKSVIPKRLKKWIANQPPEKLISEEDIIPQYQKAWQFLSEEFGKEQLGDYLEFGVCHGTSLNSSFQVIKHYELNNVRLFGFDSFEGMPANTQNEDEGLWKPGQFKSTLKETQKFLKKSGVDFTRTFLVKGWFSRTLTDELKFKYSIKKASLIMIDCDIYSSTVDALEFCKSLIIDKSIIFFDDWNSGQLADKNLGEKKAFDEFLNKYPQFKAEEFGLYSFKNNLNGKIFLVTNNDIKY